MNRQRAEEAEEEELVAVAYIGDGLGDGRWSKVQKMKFIFQDFESMPQKRGEELKPPIVNCHGYQWRLWLYPRGHTNSSEHGEYVSLILDLVGAANAIVTAKYSFRIPNYHHPQDNYEDCLEDEEVLIFEPNTDGWGSWNFDSRQRVLDFCKGCVNGNLTVEVRLQVALKKKGFLLSNSHIDKMLKLFEEAEHDDTSDVIFQVGTGTTSKIQPTKCFHAHRNIIKLGSPALAALAEGCDSGTPIPIKDVDPNTFKHVMRHIYTGEIPCLESMENDGQSLIRLSDRFGCIRLKLAMETRMAFEGFTIDNVAELILFADGHNCSLLKESAIEYFVEHSVEVMQSAGFGKIQESTMIMTELMAALAEAMKKGVAPSTRDEGGSNKRMRVAAVLQELDDKGLDLDGPYETLVQRLEDANEN